MVYVDLNPVRAGIADTPEESDYTSIQARIRAHAEQVQQDSRRTQRLSKPAEETARETSPEETRPQPALEAQPDALLPFSGNERVDESRAAIPFSFVYYLALADWTGRAIRDDKRGFIPEVVPPILTRLGIDENVWVDTVRDYGPRFSRAVGSIERLRHLAQRFGQKWLRGLKPSGHSLDTPTVYLPDLFALTLDHLCGCQIPAPDACAAAASLSSRVAIRAAFLTASSR